MTDKKIEESKRFKTNDIKKQDQKSKVDDTHSGDDKKNIITKNNVADEVKEEIMEQEDIKKSKANEKKDTEESNNSNEDGVIEKMVENAKDDNKSIEEIQKPIEKSSEKNTNSEEKKELTEEKKQESNKEKESVEEKKEESSEKTETSEETKQESDKEKESVEEKKEESSEKTEISEETKQESDKEKESAEEKKEESSEKTETSEETKQESDKKKKSVDEKKELAEEKIEEKKSFNNIEIKNSIFGKDLSIKDFKPDKNIFQNQPEIKKSHKESEFLTATPPKPTKQEDEIVENFLFKSHAILHKYFEEWENIGTGTICIKDIGDRQCLFIRDGIMLPAFNFVVKYDVKPVKKNLGVCFVIKELVEDKPANQLYCLVFKNNEEADDFIKHIKL